MHFNHDQITNIHKNAESLQHHWEKTDEFSGSGYENFIHDRRIAFAKIILETNPKSVLEIGCFGGYNLSIIHQLDPDVKLTGFDINEAALRYAKEKLNCIETVHGSIYELRDYFKEGQFDVVFTAGVLIHIPSWDFGKEEADATLIKKICENIYDISTNHVFHAEHHTKKFGPKANRHKGVRFFHNFLELYGHLGETEIETAPHAGHGFEHIIKITKKETIE
tara:strand:- start:136 stop:801 length:666 start_codon:yes stop_codon:yes gene_type:complete